MDPSQFRSPYAAHFPNQIQYSGYPAPGATAAAPMPHTGCGTNDQFAPHTPGQAPVPACAHGAAPAGPAAATSLKAWQDQTTQSNGKRRPEAKKTDKAVAHFLGMAGAAARTNYRVDVQAAQGALINAQQVFVKAERKASRRKDQEQAKLLGNAFAVLEAHHGGELQQRLATATLTGAAYGGAAGRNRVKRSSGGGDGSGPDFHPIFCCFIGGGGGSDGGSGGSGGSCGS